MLSAAALSALLLVCSDLLGRRLVVLLASVQLFIALATFVSDLWADQISLAFAAMVVPLYRVLGEHVDRVMAMMFATAALCVLPSALGMGAMFPLTMRVFSAGGARVGRDVSAVYAGNTLGSIAGAWLPGFVLMPTFGMQATLHVGIALNLLLAGYLALSAQAQGRGSLLRRVALAGAALALVGALGWAGVGRSMLRWNLTKMTLGRVPHLAGQGRARSGDVGRAGPRVLPRRSVDDGLGRALGPPLLAQEQREGRSQQRRRHADADHGRGPAAAVACPWARAGSTSRSSVWARA